MDADDLGAAMRNLTTRPHQIRDVARQSPDAPGSNSPDYPRAPQLGANEGRGAGIPGRVSAVRPSRLCSGFRLTGCLVLAIILLAASRARAQRIAIEQLMRDIQARQTWPNTITNA